MTLEQMTSRQRLLACLRREPTDRVPVSCYELCGYDEDAWYNHTPSYRPLMDQIRAKSDCILMYAPPFRYDSEIVTHSTHREDSYTVDHVTWHTPQGPFTMVTKQSDTVMTLWRVEHFLKDAADIRRFLDVEVPPPSLDMEPFCRKQKALGENGIMLLDFGDPLSDAADLLGMTQLLMMLFTDGDLIRALLERLFAYKMQAIEAVAQHDLRDVMVRIYGAEYCTPPYLPPELFPELETKYLTPMIARLRQAGAITRIHSHGNIRENLDEFVRTGVQCIDPVEPIPDGNISLAEVKAGWGDKLILMGNVELRELENAAPARIRQLVREAMEAGKPGGGFILMPTATPIDLPLRPRVLENFLVFLDAAAEYGAY